MIDPPDKPPPPNRLDEIESWTAFVVRTIFCALGALLVGYEAVFATEDDVKVRIVFGVFGVAMCGPVISASAGSLFNSLRGGRRK